ncbi:MAG: sigma-70 family RNA polymerase sigma factor [Bacteroidaceae bacterium]|nr:sigma-70 family RNA polymerase sigma factor [Bacteroidaceae bacterium]
MKRMERQTGNTSTAMHDETVLIRRILDGQTALFRQLAGRYAEQVLQMVARLIPSPEEAEEVTQDVLIEAYKCLSRFDSRQATFQTWLMRIAYHTALKHYRQHHRHVRTVDMEQQWLDSIPDDETDALLDDTDRLSFMERAIEMLKPDDQMLLSLYYFDDRSIRDIASITDHPEGYLRSRLQWIRKRLAITIKSLESNENK